MLALINHDSDLLEIQKVTLEAAVDERGMLAAPWDSDYWPWESGAMQA